MQCVQTRGNGYTRCFGSVEKGTTLSSAAEVFLEAVKWEMSRKYPGGEKMGRGRNIPGRGSRR